MVPAEANRGLLSRLFLLDGSSMDLPHTPALRQAYRDRLVRGGSMRFVHLDGDQATIAARMAARAHRYMPPTLLASQFATLEPPTDAIVVDVRDTIPVQIAKIRAALNLV